MVKIMKKSFAHKKKSKRPHFRWIFSCPVPPRPRHWDWVFCFVLFYFVLFCFCTVSVVWNERAEQLIAWDVASIWSREFDAHFGHDIFATDSMWVICVFWCYSTPIKKWNMYNTRSMAQLKINTLVDINTTESEVHGPTLGQPMSCRPQMGPMWAPWILLSETCSFLCLLDGLWVGQCRRQQQVFMWLR